MLAWFDAVKMESMSCRWSCWGGPNKPTHHVEKRDNNLHNDQRKIHLSTTNEQSVFMFTVNNLCLINS